MAKAALLNSPSDHGGYMVTAGGTMRNNGLGTCISGDMHYCPKNGHGTTPVIGTSSVRSKGVALIKSGDVAACGAIITGTGTFTLG
jgi:uncharacterized Zn-binding protein involved in type VI secretion